MGNDATISYQWTIDLTPPVVTLISGPANPTNSTTAAFVWSVSDNLGVQTVECHLDGGAYMPCSATGYTFTGLAEGPHTLYVRATDVAGNQTITTAAWTIDLTPPVVQITSGPNPFVNSTSAQITFVATVPTDVAFFECRIDGGNFSTCSSPYSSTNLPRVAMSFSYARPTRPETNRRPLAGVGRLI